MAVRKPLVLVSGHVQQLQSGDTISGGATTNQVTAPIIAIFDGGGSVPLAGSKFRVRVPYAGTITQVTMWGDQTGSAVVEVRKCTYAQYDAGATHPQTGDKISASTPPTITAAVKSQDSALTGWTTAFSADDMFEFYLSSISGFTYLSVELDVVKS